MSNYYNDEINIISADPNDLPLKPQPASTVLLIRDSQESIEVFMIKRAAATNFGNAWVFPGGKVDVEDIQHSKENRYLIAAIRECFEESGVLIAQNNLETLYSPDNQGDLDLLKEYQKKINDRKLNFHNFLEELNLKPAFNKLNFFSHWVTPRTEKKRYSTKFFLAQLPINQLALHDGYEGVESVWIAPKEALRLYSEGKFPIILPTIKSLEELKNFNCSKDLMGKNFKDKYLGNSN
ncbi:MAG: NUDIX hydrolase [Candidatus Pelagibacterales bacterium]|tara:strand:- start:113 stop:823 length:711 start_codon:yes stop_codon:yes gene_type:complete